MNLVPNRPVPPDEPIDGLLRTFYRKEMPRPWPAPLPPARPAPLPNAPRQSGATRRRLALAASVAVLGLGSLVVGGKAVPNRTADTPGIHIPADGSAERHSLGAAEKIRMSLSLEQDPMGTTIKVDVTAEDGPPPK
jgi:hypothetical protein